MSLDDIIYISMLLISIGIGHYYRQIHDKSLRKIAGSLIGFIIVFIVSGFHIIHPIITALINACIIKFVDARKCHVISFFFSFFYLIFFRTSIYFGIPYASGHANLVQMILTLKLVGLALEVSKSAELKTIDDTRKDDKETSDETYIYELSFLDVFHYAFNYVGVLTGPYYTYKTFRDSIETDFYKFIDCWTPTINKLKFVPLYVVLFLFGTYSWPLSYALTDEFYNQRSWLYRYWYIWPNFFIFRMRIYTGLVLSECVCTMAGLGAYPDICKPKPGEGPTEEFEKLKELRRVHEPEMLRAVPFNFDTIHNINPYGADFCTTYREGMKHWNITVQYWLAVNVYKCFPTKSKQVKVNMTTLVSAIWHGVYAGYYVCVCTVPLALILEDIWVDLKLKNNKGTSLKIWEWIIWFFKMHFFSYQSIAFHLLEFKLIFAYYNSVYHAGLVLWFILLFTGIYLKKPKRKQEKLSEKNKCH